MPQTVFFSIRHGATYYIEVSPKYSPPSLYFVYMYSVDEQAPVYIYICFVHSAKQPYLVILVHGNTRPNSPHCSLSSGGYFVDADLLQACARAKRAGREEEVSGEFVCVRFNKQSSVDVVVEEVSSGPP